MIQKLFSAAYFSLEEKKNEQNLIALHKNPGNYAQRLSRSFPQKKGMLVFHVHK